MLAISSRTTTTTVIITAHHGNFFHRRESDSIETAGKTSLHDTSIGNLTQFTAGLSADNERYHFGSTSSTELFT